MMYLTNQEITIRNAGQDDAVILAEWWNDGAVMAHAGFPHGLGTTAEKIIKDLASDSDEQRRRLILEIGGKAVGEMSYTISGDNDRNLGFPDHYCIDSLFPGDRGELTAEIGIKICNPDYQEKGYGRRALSLLIRELFRRKVSRIILDTNLKNTRAQHVYELLGFVKQGVRTDSWRDQEGVLQSAVDYALTEADFVDYSGESEEHPTWSYRATTGDDLERIWDLNVRNHPGKPIWERFRFQAFRHEERKMSKTYIALRNGEPLGEGTLLFDPACEAVGDLKYIVIPGEATDVNGLRIVKKYEGEGRISRLMKVMEEDAKRLGFREITIGVEPLESRNLAIYLHWGYTRYLEYEFDEGALVIYYGNTL